ncbi:MAG TPA: hypothetical protein VMB79_18315 [Jatrophihabitans sp.]|nr:hypothetical protein [Jatrophihabitans sp.]
MAIIELSDSELRLVRNALTSFLTDFGHDESEQVHEIQQMLAKLAAVQHAGAQPEQPRASA